MLLNITLIQAHKKFSLGWLVSNLMSQIFLTVHLNTLLTVFFSLTQFVTEWTFEMSETEYYTLDVCVYLDNLDHEQFPCPFPITSIRSAAPWMETNFLHSVCCRQSVNREHIYHCLSTSDALWFHWSQRSPPPTPPSPHPSSPTQPMPKIQSMLYFMSVHSKVILEEKKKKKRTKSQRSDYEKTKRTLAWKTLILKDNSVRLVWSAHLTASPGYDTNTYKHIRYIYLMCFYVFVIYIYIKHTWIR